MTSLRALQAAVRRFEEDPDASATDPVIAPLIAPGLSADGLQCPTAPGMALRPTD